MKIKLIDGTIYSVTRAEITNGRLEIDFKDKSCEEIQDIFSIPANLSNIELLTDSCEKFGELPDWTVYSGVVMLGDIKTLILSKSIDVTEQRLTVAEADALKARTIAENIEQNEVLNASVKVARASAQTLNDSEALEVRAIYSTWEDLSAKGFTARESGYKFTYDGILYKTIHKNQRFQPEWIPGVGTESIFTRIEETHTGTFEDPIPALTNMEYIKGLYYTENGNVYLMNREGMLDGEGIVLQFLPSELVGQYFELV